MGKEERVWKDPVVDTPKQASDRTWRVIFIGGINLLLGVILYAVITYSGLPINTIPGLFMCIGGTFIVIGSYMSYKDKRLV
jgi:uncharacterized membrane protein HdeD (DUF308 family)